MNSSKKENILKLIVKIFLIWLLLQFFFQTFVMFKLWLQWWIRDAIWMWKELVVIVWFLFLCYLLVKNKVSLKSLPLKPYALIFFVTLIIVFVVSILIVHTPIGNIVMSIRYNLTWFIIFPISFLITYLFYSQTAFDLLNWYNRVLKLLVVVSLWRWVMLFLMPWILGRFGYDMYGYEWDVWVRPPAVYYTQFNEWYPRNQFLFERPISRWFFLIAFWPMFFIFNIKNKWRKNMLFRWWLFGLAVLLTFSRASWAAWFLQTLILIFTQYKKQLGKILLYWLLPSVLVFWTVIYIWKDQIINRKFSNDGHIEMVLEAVGKVKEKPIFGRWAWSAGPVTHQNWWKWYNPENQYLQIWIEYWIFWFLWRFALYLYLHYFGLKTLLDDERNLWKQQKFVKNLLFCFSLWIFWLSVEWLVLHSFIDRMIVYPFTALFGICLALYMGSKKDIHKI